ncbi:DGQHR domain-containing protein DpdB [Actinomadura montaniterrae]|uniref:DGQHR domain-containing protein n=1 Tax=Actinomadura montaniterrae TaxID=1803903 RepID=A0A6L3W3M8_9ACTN|nr:DGQHR domain-containing protein DpdB [Actinomadura montaniterrae]KAB2383411.1 DGQHR domain-containing protein [Actinomadura montaniterrae]
MAARNKPPETEVRALRIVQAEEYPLYVFMLRAHDVLRFADISRVSRDEAGKLIGYQRPQVRKHVQEIVDYLDSDAPILPNPIIMALSEQVRFRSTRGGNRHADDGVCDTGRLIIPLPQEGKIKPAWIVDGQQRAIALAKARRQDFPVAVMAFVAETVRLQRDQFVRINNTRPLPRGLVTELLPEVDSPLPPRLQIQKAPSSLCDVLNADENSPFFEMIKRPSTVGRKQPKAVITDTGVVDMIKESLMSSAGCLFPYRDLGRNETDFDGIIQALFIYWSAVRDTFPDAWGKPPEKSRLMHGAGIKAMGRLMDRILGTVDPLRPDAPEQVRRHLALVAPHCRWTAGSWEDLGHRWNEIENTRRQVTELSNHLIRVYQNARRELS